MIEAFKHLPAKIPLMVSAVVIAYFLSSGPMQSLVFRKHHRIISKVLSDGTTETIGCTICDPGSWWPVFYAPVMWILDQPWGTPVEKYLALFPIRDDDHDIVVETE